MGRPRRGSTSGFSRTLFELHAQGRAVEAAAPSASSSSPSIAAWPNGRARAADPPQSWRAATGPIVGVLYGFWWQDTFAAYQSGWDPSFARHSMGSVLVLHALERAADEGARTFDFLRGREPYKYRFGARDRCDRTWLVPRGSAGALLTTRHRVRDRVHRARTREEPAHEG